MKKALLALTVMVASMAAVAGPDGKCTTSDPWRGPDKTKHAIGGAAIGAAVTYATKEPLYGSIAAVGAGFAKEALDRRSASHTCSFQDFAVTAAAGIAASYGTAWVLLPKRDGVQIAYVKAF